MYSSGYHGGKLSDDDQRSEQSCGEQTYDSQTSMRALRDYEPPTDEDREAQQQHISAWQIESENDTNVEMDAELAPISESEDEGNAIARRRKATWRDAEDTLNIPDLRHWIAWYGRGHVLGGRPINKIPRGKMSLLGRCESGRRDRCAKSIPLRTRSRGATRSQW